MNTLEKPFILPDVSRLSFDEKKHAYTLDGTKLLTGVTSVIDGTSSKQNLIQWAANMCADHIRDNSERVPDHSTLRYVDHFVIEEARTAHTRRKESAGKKGTDAHALVEHFIGYCLTHFDGRTDGLLESDLDEHDLHWRPIEPFIDWATANVDRFLAAEQRLYSESLALGGTADFVAIINGKLTIGDLKTFPKMWSADPFIQCGAYSLMWKELTGEQPEQTVIVKMCDPEDERIKKYGGKPFNVYPRYAMEEDEEMFLLRLKMYRYNQAFVSPKE